MPDLDAELLERVAGWCAEAGRTTGAAEIRRALGGLVWDELLAVRALLADPPPARPLGPFALADLARGLPADAAAERERGGQYPSLEDGDEPEIPAVDAPAAPAPERKAGKRARSPGIVIRRARELAPPEPAPSPAAPLLEELFLPGGRTVLERLVRRLGARRHALVATLAEGWRSADGRPLAEADLARLLDHHGLARAFARRERDELLHALRAAGGLRAAAAARLGLGDPEALDAALSGAGATGEAEKIREARRAELRARATLAERVRLLLSDPARLEDLGVIAEFEEDLRRRLPEHVRAVGAGGGRGPVVHALAQSLSISPAQAKDLADRLGVPVEGALGVAADVSPQPQRARQKFAPSPAGALGGSRPPRRPAGARPGAGPRSDPRGRGEGRGPLTRFGPRSGIAGTRPERPGVRPAGSPRPGGARPSGGGGARPSGGGARGFGGARPSGGGARPFGGARPSGGGARPFGGARPSGAGKPAGGARPPRPGRGRPPRRGPAR